MAIQSWKRDDARTKVVLSKYGKEVRIEWFTNPTTGAEEDFLLFGMRDGMVILPVTRGGMVVAGYQFMQGANKVTLELPAGRADFEGESAVEGARRELLEETGYSAEELVPLGPPLYLDTRSSWTRNFLFLALGCAKVQEPEGSEEIDPILIPLPEWIRITQEELEEPLMVAATFRAIPHLRERGLL